MCVVFGSMLQGLTGVPTLGGPFSVVAGGDGAKTKGAIKKKKWLYPHRAHDRSGHHWGIGRLGYPGLYELYEEVKDVGGADSL